MPVKNWDSEISCQRLALSCENRKGVKSKKKKIKTGFVKQGDLEIVEWGKITTDYKYSKIIQVLAYALMIKREIPFEKAQAGIISFKNLSNGYLKFVVKT